MKGLIPSERFSVEGNSLHTNFHFIITVFVSHNFSSYPIRQSKKKEPNLLTSHFDRFDSFNSIKIELPFRT